MSAITRTAVKRLARRTRKPLDASTACVPTSHLAVRRSRHGLGVFAVQPIKKDAAIVPLVGRLFMFEELPVPYDAVADHYIQVDAGLYLGPSGQPDDFFNHSCDPNCGIRRYGLEWYICAIKPIQSGAELTIDYSTTMMERDWTMRCDCLTDNCRKVVADFDTLPLTVQRRYLRLDIVPIKHLFRAQRKTSNKL